MARIPKPVAGVDLMRLPLNTLEGFVLSRVDARSAVEDIAMMSGLDADKVQAILERLADLGAVELPWSPRPQKSGRAPQASGRAAGSTQEPDAHFASDRPRYPAAEAQAVADIPIETRKRILNAYYALEGRNYYQLLGVPRDSEKKQIRHAYFELSKIFHPDAYFGKDLGSFKPKMEAVFKRLTEAYDTLGKGKKRKEYDEYLATTEQTHRVRMTLDSIELSREEIEKARRASEARAAIEQSQVEASKPRSDAATPRPSDRSAARGSPSVQPRRPSGLQPAASGPPAPVEPSEPPMQPRPQPSTSERRARVRDRVRQRFNTFESQRKPVPAAPAPELTPGERRRSLIDGLKQSIHQSSSLSGTPDAQVQSALKRARDAELAGDALLAASHLQAALGIDPSRPELLTEYDRVSKVVARNLAANYEKQAAYEEKTGNWQAAARSWMRVSDGRPEDANAARHAAEAMLKASDDLHVAQRYAQKAVALEARSVPNLTVLARVYLAAGLKLNALRELEKAAQLAPNDEMVNNLLREAR